MKYGLQGSFIAVEGRGDKLASVLLEAAGLMQNAEGCLHYIVGQYEDDPDRIYIHEVWESKEHHDHSLNLEGVGELISMARPLIKDKPKSVSINILGGTGLD
ncbi:MAG: antibiotic biosynthesis monooxygenase [Balneolaceae bacterium]|nr:antibiotic biosynthesis monooxygenase [Balneolaceae bacterium]